MSFYTERHGMRKSIDHSFMITYDVYGMLFDCCKKYYDNIAWKFPAECPDGNGCCGLDLQQFSTQMKFLIPALYRNNDELIDRVPKNKFPSFYKNNLSWDITNKPNFDCYENSETQYALFDLIEFIGQNCKDFEQVDYHSFFGHYHIRSLNTRKVAYTFRNEINNVFQLTGLLYTLSDKMMVERIIEYGILTPEVETIVASVKENGLKSLLNEAVNLFKQPNPAVRKDAVEKLWDAFERLKTYYNTLSKKASVTKIIEDMSDGQVSFKELFDKEFHALTDIGNGYRIRHHETDKIDIQDIRHYDYLFNRCLALIAMALQYLPKEDEIKVLEGER